MSDVPNWSSDVKMLITKGLRVFDVAILDADRIIVVSCRMIKESKNCSIDSKIVVKVAIDSKSDKIADDVNVSHK